MRSAVPARIAAALVVIGMSVDARAENLVSLSLSEVFIMSTWKDHGLDLTPLAGETEACVPGEILADVSNVDFDRPVTVLRMLIGAIPSRARVLPTERYYYYKFDLGERAVSGNLRFVDIEQGLLHMGYFDTFDTKSVRIATFDKSSGVDIVQDGASAYLVTFEGRTVRFDIVTDSLDKPESVELLPDEEFVSGVLDESGFPFVMLWNEAIASFYFVVDEQAGVPDDLVSFGPEEHRTVVGKSSRFVFYRDQPTGRLLLIGVSADNIERNNYFDGPFDQVPPRLDIKTKIVKAYPYVTLGGGIDPHGVFVDNPGSRVAISPYAGYRTLGEITSLMAQCAQDQLAGPALWAKLTYESKRDFHKQFEGRTPKRLSQLLAGAGPSEHRVFVSQAWPANHSGATSRSWPSDHVATVSGGWPRNHLSTTSRSGTDDAAAPGESPDAEGEAQAIPASEPAPSP